MDNSTSAIERVVDRHLNAIFGSKPELYRFFTTHQLRPKLHEALQRELYFAGKKKALNADVDTIDHALLDVVKFWAGQILAQKEREMRSHAEQRRIQDDQRKVEIAKDAVRGIVENIDEDDFNLKEI